MTHIARKRKNTGRVGRPRANPRPLERAPEEEILIVAGRLFAEKGFAGTSTREIAEAAGLRQPSLFHYYPKKEKILEALLDRIGQHTLSVAEALDRIVAPASVKLYRLVQHDVFSICDAPYPMGSLAYLPEVRRPAFPQFWENEERRGRTYEDLIGQGIRAGDFTEISPRTAAMALAGMSGGALTWYMRDDTGTPEEVAHMVAGLQLRSLLNTPSELGRIREQAQRIDLPAAVRVA